MTCHDMEIKNKNHFPPSSLLFAGCNRKHRNIFGLTLSTCFGRYTVQCHLAVFKFFITNKTSQKFETANKWAYENARSAKFGRWEKNLYDKLLTFVMSYAFIVYGFFCIRVYMYNYPIFVFFRIDTCVIQYE